MTMSKKIEGFIQSSSWIRKMFEEGARLKAEFGPENVFDFSLGNPDIPPPEAFLDALAEETTSRQQGIHGYMPNPGFPGTRQAVAEYLTREQGVRLLAEDVFMTCGAAGGLNVMLKTILNPQEEVIVPAPFFVEYRFYVDNHGGVLKIVPTQKDFSLDLEAIDAAISERTRAVLINSPNNPTGQVYTERELDSLGTLLRHKSEALGRTIYLLGDEPYRKIVFDGIEVPSLFQCYEESIVTTSYSKDLSLAGERIGFLAINSRAAYREQLRAGMALCNRTLGYVNAPALMQRVVARVQGACADVSIYAERRRILCDGLKKAGFSFLKPKGTFFVFPKTPVKDDVAFVRALQKERILAVPGSGFGGPGHVRLAFCMPKETIINALPAFKRVMKHF